MAHKATISAVHCCGVANSGVVLLRNTEIYAVAVFIELCGHILGFFFILSGVVELSPSMNR